MNTPGLEGGVFRGPAASSIDPCYSFARDT